MDYIKGITPADFLIKFANKDTEALLYIGSEDLPKLAELLSSFLTSKNIENTLITRPIKEIKPESSKEIINLVNS